MALYVASAAAALAIWLGAVIVVANLLALSVGRGSSNST
jgi:hypothetical protein